MSVQFLCLIKFEELLISILYTLAKYNNVLLNPVLKQLPALLGLLISVTFVSALLTYPIMPWLTKLPGFWLYPSFSKTAR